MKYQYSIYCFAQKTVKEKRWLLIIALLKGKENSGTRCARKAEIHFRNGSAERIQRYFILSVLVVKTGFVSF